MVPRESQRSRGGCDMIGTRPRHRPRDRGALAKFLGPIFASIPSNLHARAARFLSRAVSLHVPSAVDKEHFTFEVAPEVRVCLRTCARVKACALSVRSGTYQEHLTACAAVVRDTCSP